MIEISSAEIQDCDEIIQLQRLAYESEAKLYQDWTIPPLRQTTAVLQQEFPQLIILKATHAGKIVGSVRAQLINGICHIGRLIVHPDFQKQGIGSALLRKIEQAFDQAKTYELFTGSKSESNIRFYQAHGYHMSHIKNISDRLELIYLSKTNKL
ncbi:N-acetyltransferase [Cellvibrio zantedeschiae]|uniref:N-acetyltransferase n=1 Tax=Cellvibrio zantedeschiae TaxID=1237077 RepID=A0ABQ3AU78_9GAMM|nr:GNAT family N-acetyltransferase [Cellvibrio zantedeschiae]GGY67446.1 N-acetyltransferase [Cellvibrio zantedeschiae]